MLVDEVMSQSIFLFMSEILDGMDKKLFAVDSLDLAFELADKIIGAFFS